MVINPLMPGENKRVTLSAAGLFKYVWPFCSRQALKGYTTNVLFYFVKKILLHQKLANTHTFFLNKELEEEMTVRIAAKWCLTV